MPTARVVVDIVVGSRVAAMQLDPMYTNQNQTLCSPPMRTLEKKGVFLGLVEEQQPTACLPRGT